MAKRQTYTSADDATVPIRRKRHWAWRFLRIGVILSLIMVAINFGVGFLYHGPKTLDEVVAVMPGVPIFPFAKISPSNHRAQRAMAIPIRLMRAQGATQVEVAQINAPADADFVVEWYRTIAPSQKWTLIGQEETDGGTRMLFLRQREGLQVTVGRTRDILTPVQFIYLHGITASQRRQLANAIPAAVIGKEPTPTTRPAPKPPVAQQPTTPVASGAPSVVSPGTPSTKTPTATTPATTKPVTGTVGSTSQPKSPSTVKPTPPPVVQRTPKQRRETAERPRPRRSRPPARNTTPPRVQPRPSPPHTQQRPAPQTPTPQVEPKPTPSYEKPAMVKPESPSTPETPTAPAPGE